MFSNQVVETAPGLVREGLILVDSFQRCQGFSSPVNHGDTEVTKTLGDFRVSVV